MPLGSARRCLAMSTGNDRVSRLSSEGVAALRYAGQRQLTRWGKRQLSPREAQRREALSDALRALAPLRHCDCELRRLAGGGDGS
jgi:hypothetical protein